MAHLPPCDAKLSEYTPCQDVTRSLKFDRERLVYRERHCPEKEELLKCRIPAPHGYTVPFRWPESRDSVLVRECAAQGVDRGEEEAELGSLRRGPV